MVTTSAFDSALATIDAPEAGPRKCTLDENDPVTLQVVLLGKDGVVIASDTCMVNFVHPSKSRTTEPVSKIEVKAKLAYIFAGDACARDVGAEVANKAENSGARLSVDLINELSNVALENYKASAGGEFSEQQYRKIVWVQADENGFTFWSAFYRNKKFEANRHPVSLEGKCNLHAGDDGNPAMYIIEYYYKEFPLRTVSDLKKMAAHAILTGATFSKSVSGLEMVVGDRNGFAPVSSTELDGLERQSRAIHKQNSECFRDSSSA